MYYDEEETKTGHDFADKYCSGFKGLQIFLPLVNDAVLDRMKKHDASKIDHVLAEWIIALSKKRRILPVLLGEEIISGYNKIKDDLPNDHPGAPHKQRILTRIEIFPFIQRFEQRRH